MKDSLSNLQTCFPRAEYYSDQTVNLAVQESASSFRGVPFSERHLQCLWADPRLRPSKLKTSEGDIVEIEYPGYWNLEAGPDFANAVLLIGEKKRRICGDLEIHIHPNGWKQHGHAQDLRYKNVRFHIVYFRGTEIPGLIQIPLQDELTADSQFSFENIDLTAYPYSITSGDFPLLGIDPDEKTGWLEAAGEERLKRKAERLEKAIQKSDPLQVLWTEVMASLGYKNNKIPFRKLADRLLVEQVRTTAKNPEQAYALLLGVSGLLPTQPNPKWPDSARKFIRTLWDFWWKQPEDLKEQALNKKEWTLSGIRPTNHPVRRLMAAAHYAFCIEILAEHPQNLTTFSDNFWNGHISWNKPCKTIALVGPSRANSIITNILIPYRAAMGLAGLQLENLPPEPSNSIIKQTAYMLFGPDHTPSIYKSALARQGLIQIFHDYLITHRLAELKEHFQGPKLIEKQHVERPFNVN